MSSTIEILIREALKPFGIKNSVKSLLKVTSPMPEGVRETEMMRRCGHLAWKVQEGELTFLRAANLIYEVGKHDTSQVAGDNFDPEKGVAKFVEFLADDLAKKRTLPPGWDEGLTAEAKARYGITEWFNNERWNYERIDAYIREQMMLHPDAHSAGFRAGIKLALEKLASNPDIEKSDEALIISLIKMASQKTLTKEVILDQVRALRKSFDILGNDQTEIAKATIEDWSKSGELRSDGGSLWQAETRYWQPLQMEQIHVSIQDRYGHLPAAKRDNDHNGIYRIVLKRTKKPLKVIDKPAVNFLNGVLTEDLELVPHNPDYGFTYVLPFCYRPELAGNFPLFSGMTREHWGHHSDYAQKLDALQEYMAATLFGVATKYTRALCFHGPGNCGKTRYVKLMQALMPKGCLSSVRLQDWGNEFHRAAMFGKLMNICGEISEHELIDGESFKLITEGHMIGARFPYGQPFDFEPACAQWIAGNHMPRTRDTSQGWSRRWLFLSFDRVFGKDEVDVDILTRIIAEEREAIIAWVVQGLPRLKENGYTLPASHAKLTANMDSENNSVYDFLNTARGQSLRIGPEYHRGLSETSVSDYVLYRAYEYFCIARGAKRFKQVRFRALMKELESVFRFKVRDDVDARGALQTTFQWITVMKDAPNPAW